MSWETSRRSEPRRESGKALGRFGALEQGVQLFAGDLGVEVAAFEEGQGVQGLGARAAESARDGRPGHLRFRPAHRHPALLSLVVGKLELPGIAEGNALAGGAGKDLRRDVGQAHAHLGGLAGAVGVEVAADPTVRAVPGRKGPWFRA
jgi:hypothetical protein